MSLIAFHRVLIGAGILFCFGFAAWELVLWWVTRGTAALLVGLVFLALGVALTVYLSRLKTFVGYRDEPEERR